MTALSTGMAMVAALAKVAIKHYETKPNYDQKVAQQAKTNLAEYMYEKHSEHPDNRRVDVLETWLKIFAEELL